MGEKINKNFPQIHSFVCISIKWGWTTSLKGWFNWDKNEKPPDTSVGGFSLIMRPLYLRAFAGGFTPFEIITCLV